MVGKTSILENLKRLETLYNESVTSEKKCLFYSKLAILELCGWIEESMDDIVRKCANRKLKENANQEHIDNTIKLTYGFVYDKHFRKMLIELIGLINVERLEMRIDKAKFQNMKSTLGLLRSFRDIEAHTHLKGTTRILDAPSATINKFSMVYEGLKEFEEKLKILSL